MNVTCAVGRKSIGDSKAEVKSYRLKLSAIPLQKQRIDSTRRGGVPEKNRQTS